jgi:threonine synthase
VNAAAMQFASSRAAGPQLHFGAALLQGLAPDGGLYVPQHWPQLGTQDFAGAEDLPGVAVRLIAPFAAGDSLGAALPQIAREAFDFPAPRVSLTPDDRLSVLELFHGPTAAFKDFGARFLAFDHTRGDLG